jgi:hypothetical protein
LQRPPYRFVLHFVRVGWEVMDIATSLGLLCGVGVVGLVIMMGGDLHMFVSEHAFIVIFGGSFAATLIRLAQFFTGYRSAPSSLSHCGA